jgi:hypothetical protein
VSRKSRVLLMEAEGGLFAFFEYHFFRPVCGDNYVCSSCCRAERNML